MPRGHRRTFIPDLDILDPASAQLAAAFLMPGVVALYVRSRFVPVRTQSQPVIAYLAVSIDYHGLAFAFAVPLPPGPRLPIAYMLAGPAALGLALGLEVRLGLLHGILGRIGIQPIRSIPTAWNRKFGRMKPHWMQVTFKDGTRVAGYCGKKSFMLSDRAERDLYAVGVPRGSRFGGGALCR